MLPDTFSGLKIYEKCAVPCWGAHCSAPPGTYLDLKGSLRGGAKGKERERGEEMNGEDGAENGQEGKKGWQGELRGREENGRGGFVMAVGCVDALGRMTVIGD